LTDTPDRPRALIAEPSVPISGALRKFLEGARFEVRVVHFLDEAVHRVRAEEPDIIFTSASTTFDGETLCAKIKTLRPLCPVVLMYPPEEHDPDEHAAKVGADAYLVGPIKRGTVVSTAKTMLRMSELRRNVEKLEANLKKHIVEPPADVQHMEGSSADFDFFKRFLLMELKRARRYKSPASFLLVSIDHFAERLSGSTQGLRLAVLGEALSAITRGIRDIDLAVPSTENRFLVFLPHTRREGALVVASRLHHRISKLSSVEGMTASVGVASFDPMSSKTEVSFGSLMKDATEALRRAQLAGGNRVDAGTEQKKKRDRISMG
jgi:diguanylate cyclase (GGDEF)-like protein